MSARGNVEPHQTIPLTFVDLGLFIMESTRHPSGCHQDHCGLESELEHRHTAAEHVDECLSVGADTS